jgi:probable rRNA maturation factor
VSKDWQVYVDVGACEAADPRAIERAVRLTLEATGGPAVGPEVQPDAPSTAEISVALMDDPSIAALNERFLGRQGPTDVLAFSLGDAVDVVGDVYVGFEQASRQAAELGISLAEELVRLAIHGTLHVLGHDHPEDEERDASAMFALQEHLVRRAMQVASAL